MKLSILMPVYNEGATVTAAIKRVMAVDYPCEMELVIVDDGSGDDTADHLQTVSDERIRLHHHDRNQGKGAAISTAAGQASGDYMLVCDADLEYDPEEIPKLLAPVLAGETEVVYGTRTFGSHAAYSFWYVMGNKGVTMVANVLFNAYISDLETCFKLIPLPLYRSLGITEKGFGMEAQITGRLLRRGIRPFEVPVSYKARDRVSGKKITWKDGVQALWILARVRLSRRR